MIGTILNAAAIVLGGVTGRLRKQPLSLTNQSFFKAALGLATILCGLRLTWFSFNGPLWPMVRQLGVVLVALMLGKLAGRLLRLQKGSNRLGQYARERMAAVKPDRAGRFAEGFLVCTVLFCVAPLGLLGAVCEGITARAGEAPGFYYPLLIKAVMDGLAMMSFVALFGWGAVLSAIPVLVLQGTICLLCLRFVQPVLAAHHLIDPLNATIGLLVFCVALLIFEIKKVEVADYLPSLVFAPLLAWWLN